MAAPKVTDARPFKILWRIPLKTQAMHHNLRPWGAYASALERDKMFAGLISTDLVEFSIQDPEEKKPAKKEAPVTASEEINLEPKKGKPQGSLF